MTEDSPSASLTPSLPPPPSVPPRAPITLERIALILAVSALVGVVLLAGLAWHADRRISDTREEIARRLAQSDQLQREIQTGTEQNREAIERLQAKVGGLESRLAEIQSQQMAIEAMYQELSRVREDRLLAELEQDLAIAAQQLHLAGNVQAALIALSSAQARLAQNAQPRFLPLRRLIAQDIERLKAMPAADVPGIALRIDAIIGLVPDLPLAFEQRPARKVVAETQPGPVLPSPTFFEILRAWGGDIWGELRQLVRIERMDRPDAGLLAPRETFFLRENMRLRLLSARIALLARDARSYHSDIAQARQWLESHFDLSAPSVQAAQATLDALGKLDVGREPADLNETLSALRNFKLAREQS